VYWTHIWYRSQSWTLSTRPRLEFHGKRGATVESLKPYLMSVWPPRHHQPPRTVIIHVGTNNLGGRHTARELREQLESLWDLLPCLSRRTTFLWSDILPKSGLCHAGDIPVSQVLSLDKVRRDVNRFARRLSVRGGGAFISHPNFTLPMSHLLRSDGIHLSERGCQLFVRDLLSGPAELQGGRVPSTA